MSFDWRVNTVSNRHGVECFVSPGPERNILVPVICRDCVYFDPGNDSSYLGPADYPECKVLLRFPTRKGTCKRRKVRS